MSEAEHADEAAGAFARESAEVTGREFASGSAQDSSAINARELAAVNGPNPVAVIAPELPRGLPPDRLSPVVLAYIGDAVFEVYVRQHLVAENLRRPHELHRAATRYVSAAAQASLLRRWMPHLTEQEADMVRRGRNTKSQPPRNAEPADYRQATGLECLIGYLFYKGERKRLEELIGMAFAPEEEA